MKPPPDYRDALSYALKLANKPAYGRHRIHDALMRHPFVLEEQGRRGLGRADALAWRITRHAADRVAVHGPETARFEIASRIYRYRQQAEELTWGGRTGPTDRRVLEAVYLSAFISRSARIGLASRTCGLRAGVDYRVAIRSLRRLEERHGCILRTHKGGANLGSRFKLTAFPRTRTDGSTPRREAPLSVLRGQVLLGVQLLDETGYQRRLLQHDAFRPRALGDVGWLVVRLLDDARGISPLEIAQRTGLKIGGVEHQIAELESVGVVSPMGDGYVRGIEPILFAGLDDIAVSLGTHGQLERDAEQYERERRERDDRLPTPVESNASHISPIRTVSATCHSWWETWWGSLSEGSAYAVA